jgi:hypothetical protein
MKTLYLSYEDCRNMVSSFLKQQQNLSLYCSQNGFSKAEYAVALKIKNKSDKKNYPNFIIKQLSLMGFEAEKMPFFSITPKTN